jgi:hypothetical protein
MTDLPSSSASITRASSSGGYPPAPSSKGKTPSQLAAEGKLFKEKIGVIAGWGLVFLLIFVVVFAFFLNQKWLELWGIFGPIIGAIITFLTGQKVISKD